MIKQKTNLLINVIVGCTLLLSSAQSFSADDKVSYRAEAWCQKRCHDHGKDRICARGIEGCKEEYINSYHNKHSRLR